MYAARESPRPSRALSRTAVHRIAIQRAAATLFVGGILAADAGSDTRQVLTLVAMWAVLVPVVVWATLHEAAASNTGDGRELAVLTAVALPIGVFLLPQHWTAALVIAGLIAGMESHRLDRRAFLYFLGPLGVSLMGIAVVEHRMDMIFPVATLVAMAIPINLAARRERSELTLAEQRLESLLDAASVLQWESHDAESHSSVRGPVERITGYSPTVWLERYGGDIPDGEHDVIDRSRSIPRADGSAGVVREIVQRVASTEECYLHGIWVDITEQERNIGLLERQARIDQRTGLANRREWLATMDDYGGLGYFRVVVYRVEGLTAIGALLGHHVNEELMLVQANRLSNACPPGPSLFRIGPNLLSIVSRSDQDLPLLDQRLADVLRRPCALNGVSVELEIAAVALEVAPDVQTATIEARVDELLRRAGESEVVTSPLASDPEVVGRDLYSARVLSSQLESEIEFYLQLIVDVSTRQVRTLECLARRRNVCPADASPARFLPVIEAMGLGKRLDEHAIRSAVEALVHFTTTGLDCRLAVNISQRGLANTALVHRINAMVDDAGIDPSRLIVEVSERDLINDGGAMIRNLSLLREHGMRLSLDDFGTGTSSLTHLRNLPINEIKIDRSFVGDLFARPNDAIVRHLNDMALSLGLRVVAEGVESWEVYQQLSAWGCPAIQGYLVGRPTHPDALLPPPLDGPHRLWWDPSNGLVTRPDQAASGITS